MPKMLPELIDLKIGMRQSSILEAIKKYGLATVGDVIEYVKNAHDLDLSKKNVQQSLRRTIEKDLNTFCGIDGNLDKKYYDKKTGDEVLPDDLELDKNGDIKNIYNIKFYILGGSHHVKGNNLLKEYGINFIAQRSTIPEWEVYELDKGLKKNSIIILISIGHDYLALSTTQEEIPFKIIIGRSSASIDYKKIQEEICEKYGNKTSILTLNHQTISSLLGKNYDGHAMIEFKKDPNRVIVTDFNSANGTFWAPLEFINVNFKSPTPKKDIGTYVIQDETDVTPIGSYLVNTPIGQLKKMTDWNRLDLDSTKYSLEDGDGNLLDMEVLNDPDNPIDLSHIEASSIYTASELLPVAIKVGYIELYLINSLWPGLKTR